MRLRRQQVHRSERHEAGDGHHDPRAEVGRHGDVGEHVQDDALHRHAQHEAHVVVRLAKRAIPCDEQPARSEARQKRGHAQKDDGHRALGGRERYDERADARTGGQQVQELPPGHESLHAPPRRHAGNQRHGRDQKRQFVHVGRLVVREQLGREEAERDPALAQREPHHEQGVRAAPFARENRADGLLFSLPFHRFRHIHTACRAFFAALGGSRTLSLRPIRTFFARADPRIHAFSLPSSLTRNW